MNNLCKLLFFFYRVKNDSNDDCRYGAFRDGDNCKGSFEKRNPKQPCEYSHKIHNSNNFLKEIISRKSTCIVYHAI